MDFSSLDLLASTALRDNNSASSDNSTASSDTQRPQNNHLDSVENEEDDDDEADSKGPGVKETTLIVKSDLLIEDMGSVKCGKHKKNSVKPMSIFVRDGKCVGKHIPTDTSCQKERGGQAGVDSSMTVVSNVKCVQYDKDVSPNSTASAPSATSPKCATQNGEKDPKAKSVVHLCNGINSTTRKSCENDVVSNSEDKLVQRAGDSPGAAVSDRCATAEASSDSRLGPGDQTCEESTHGSAEGLEQTLEKDCDSRDECDTAASCDVATPSPVAPSCSEDQGAATDSQDTQGEESAGCSQSAQNTASVQTADTDSTNSVTEGEGGDSVPSQIVCTAVTDDSRTTLTSDNKADTTVETQTPSSICDEDCVAGSASSQRSVGLDTSSIPSKHNMDQNSGSSGQKQLRLSSCSPPRKVDCILSPPPPPPPPLLVSAELALEDHSYCSRSKAKFVENTDDSGDAFESADENMSADEIERRPRSLSVDSEYLQYGVSGPTSQQNDKLALLSPTLSVDSVSNDSSLSEHSTAVGGQCYSILMGGPHPTRTTSRPNLTVDMVGGAESAATNTDIKCRLSSHLSEAGTNSSLLDSSSITTLGPKCGKFRIGTFGSFSNSHLELEKESKKSKLKIGLSSDSVMKTSHSSPAIASPGSPFPLLQSPGIEWDRSDAGSECPDDVDSSTTDDKFLSSSHDSDALGVTIGQVWRHPVFHDHDYCCKEVSEEYLGKPITPATQVKTGKRKYVRKKDRLEAEEEKLRKGKYLKRELLKQDNRFTLGMGRGAENRQLTARSLLAESLMSKPNPVGRPRKRTEKQLEEYDAETGTKMKITGKYQDQYVYYLNKSSRSRRRKVDDKLPHGDKIILPAPKPGDIVVPHLTDADCEAIRHGGRMALLNGNAHPAGSVHLPHADSGDMDSSIVNTILSMETEHDLTTPLDTYEGEGHAEDFGDIEGNLTSEQVKMLFDCLDDYQMEETTTSQELDLFTSAEAMSVPSTTVDSLAATTVEEDFIVPGVGSAVSNITDSTEEVSGLSQVEPDIDSPIKVEPESLADSFKSELSQEDTKALINTGLPVPPTSQPSVEKNLEFLKTPFTRSDFFPAVSSGTSSSSQGLFSPTPPTSLMSPIPEIKTEDVHQTPWIVTVTLYWNDIPAIVISNMPHVRLVDIHRQILPAKDTGILKKRCQLMNIQVSNCSEMQRYFLVQYGRAHNSKSTLVISKDEAQRLITYYAHPPPRNLRGEEGASLRRSSSYAELRSMMEKPVNAGRHAALAFNQPRKRGGFRRRALPTRSHNPSPEPVSPSVTAATNPLLVAPVPTKPTLPVKGLRHKKINFREMLKGEDSSPHTPLLLDGSGDHDSALVEEVPVTKGKGSKAAASNGHKKRRSSKELGGSPAKRGRKAMRKKEEVKDGSQETPTNPSDMEIIVDKVSPSTAIVNTKNKKRSPGSSANGSLGTSGRSPKSKFGPIKVNVKSLVRSGGSSDGSQPRKKNLFGRKSSSSTDVVVDVAEEPVPRVNPLRVLRISHQDMETACPPSPHVLSPVAEVHLDLYKRSSSPCVKCDACHKFLTVPAFLKHQHASGGEEIMDSVKAAGVALKHRRRMLVPMNKENISLEEQCLWNEFVALQETMDHSDSVASMGTYPLTPLSPASPIGSSLSMFGEVRSPGVGESQVVMTPESPHPAQESLHHLHNGHDDKVHTENTPDSQTLAVMGDKCEPSVVSDDMEVRDLSFTTEAAAHLWDTELSICSPLSPPPPTHTQHEEKCLANSVESGDQQTLFHPKTVVAANKKQCAVQRPRKVSPAANVRTSSRKRETKRLYSFEKYEFGGGKKGGKGDGEAQDFDDELSGIVLDDVNNVVIGNTCLLPVDVPMEEPQNA